MKLDPHHKTEKLGTHIPGFRGYGVPYAQETDLLLRRYLSGELAKMRDRLADLIVTRGDEGGLHESLAECLRRLAALKEEITQGAESGGGGAVGTVEEERLIEFDLLLLDKTAALQTPLEEMEWSREEARTARALASLQEGIAQVADLYRRRRELFGASRQAPLSP